MRSMLAHQRASQQATKDLARRLQSLEDELDRYREESLQRERIREVASTRMAAVFRGAKGRKIAAKRRFEVGCIISVQRFVKCMLARWRLDERVRQRKQVVPPGVGLRALVAKSTVLRQRGRWRELLSEETGMVWYYKAIDGETQWTPPKVFASDDFTCNWGYCNQSFHNADELLRHREEEHKWRCPACQLRQSCAAWPKCVSCGNKLDEDGYQLGRPVPELMEPMELVNELAKRNRLFRDERSKLIKFLNDLLAKEEAVLMKKANGVLDYQLAKRITRIPAPHNRFETFSASRYYNLRRPSNTIAISEEAERVAGVVENLEAASILEKTDAIAAEELRVQVFSQVDGSKHRTGKQQHKQNGELDFENDFSSDDDDDRPVVAVKLPWNKTTGLTRQQMQDLYAPLIRKGEGKLVFPSGASYVGNILQGKPHGRGVMTYTNGARYKGEFKHNVRSGNGVYESPDGVKYVGGWNDNRRHGYGVLRHSNGEVYEGEWSNGKIHGTGKLTSRNGDSYSGSFNKGKYEGKCIFEKSNGDCFRGQCLDGKATGYGVLVRGNGERYAGEWKNDMRNGRGKCVYPNGDSFVGTWQNGKMHGPGRFENNETGESYDGMFDSGRMTGLGRYHFANGDMFFGEFKNGHVQGEGIYFYKDTGNVYNGNWFQGKKNGYGELYMATGAVYKGNWSNNNINGTGTLVASNGDKYTGNFKNNYKDGHGVLEFAVGNTYTGTLRKGKLHGMGEMKYIAGHYYKGEWQSNKKHGKGKFVYSDGNLYEGNFAKDVMHGKGKLVYFPNSPLRESYEGEFEDGLRCGYGVYKYCDRSEYQGCWKDGLRHGFGKFTFSDGRVFEGDYIKDSIKGHGKLTEQDGTTYNGALVNGQYHGHGVLIKPTGERYEGEFANGSKHGEGELLYMNGDRFTGRWAKGHRVGKGKFWLHTVRPGNNKGVRGSMGMGDRIKMTVFAG